MFLWNDEESDQANLNNQASLNNWKSSAKTIGQMVSSGSEVKDDLDALLNGLKSNSGFTRAKTIGKIVAMIFGGGG